MSAATTPPGRPSRRDDYRPRFRAGLLAPRFWPTWLGVGLLWILTRLPHGLRHGLGAWVGQRLARGTGKRQRFVAVNLDWCFPDWSPVQRQALAQRYFERMAQTLLDYGLLWWAGAKRLDRLITLEGREHIEACLAADRPVILLTGHGVSLDMGALAITRYYPSVGMIKPARNAVIEWLMTRGRTRFNGQVYLREDGIRPVVRALRAGRLFYYLPDEDLGATQTSVFVPFFGIPTATLTALGRLARMTGAAVLPCMSYYLPDSGRYVVRIHPALDDFPGGDALADATRMNAALEALIRVAPEQYMWSLRLFQTRPGGERSPYETPSD